MAQKLGGLMFFMSKLKKAERVALKVADNIDVIGLNYGSSRYEIDGKKISRKNDARHGNYGKRFAV